MIISLYLLFLFIVFIKSRDLNDDSIRKIVIWSYNYIIAFIIYLVLLFSKDPTNDTKQIILNVLDSFYMAAKGVAFDKGFQMYRDIFYLFGDEKAVEIQIWSIFLIASLSTTLIVATILFEKKIREYKLLFKYNRQKEKIIVIGNNRNAVSLIQNIFKKEEYKGSVVSYFTNDTIEDDNYRNIRVKRIDDILKENPFNKFNKNHEYRIIIMLNNKNENIEWLGKLTNITKCDYNNIHFTVLCNNEQLRFNDWMGKSLDIYLFSEEQLVMDRLLQTNSPIKSLKENHDFITENNFNYIKNEYSACIIGFGDLGEEILLSVYENSRFIKKDLSEAMFKAVVIDKNMKSLKANFLSDVPYFKTNKCIDFIDSEIGTDEFYDVIKKRLSHLHQIFISTGDNALNIQTALKLSNFIKNELMIDFNQNDVSPKIIIFIRCENYLLEPLLLNNKMLKIINVCEDIYTCDNLVFKVGDHLAKQVHDDYKENNNDIEEWNGLTNSEKDSNRAVVRDIRNKKGLINLWDDCYQDLYSLKNLNVEEELCWRLAIYEHYRWNSFHFAHGWTRLNEKELTVEEKMIYEKRKNVILKKHLCLTTWDELPGLPCQVNKDFQKNDYNLFKQKEEECNYGSK